MQKASLIPYQTLRAGFLLAMTAGFLDAYSYLEGGGVFAGLQTGNLILLGLNLGQFKYWHVIEALVSLLMFIVGVAAVRIFQNHFPDETKVMRKRVILIYEMVVFLVVGLLSGHVSMTLITGLLSMAAAAQLQEFRLLNNRKFTSLMMTGHLRTLSENLIDLVIINNNQRNLRVVLETIIILVGFIIGAFVSGLLGMYFKGLTILFGMLILGSAIVWGK